MSEIITSSEFPEIVENVDSRSLALLVKSKMLTGHLIGRSFATTKEALKEFVKRNPSTLLTDKGRELLEIESVN